MGIYDGEFDLTQNRDNGQLWLADRKLLWSTVRDLKPQLAIETGTWRGGGSTYFIASALKMNGGGVLHTVEWNHEMHAEAKALYAGPWSHLRDYVRLHGGDSVPLLKAVLEQLGNPPIDFVFIDGGEEQAIPEFDLLAPRVRVGGVLMSHDWYNGKRMPKLEEQAAEGIWNLRIVGTGDGNFESGSVGITHAVKLR